MNLAFACSDWSSYHFFIDHQTLIMPFTDFPDHGNFDDHPLKGQVNVNCKRNVQCLHIFVRSSNSYTYVHVSYLRSCIHYVFSFFRQGKLAPALKVVMTATLVGSRALRFSDRPWIRQVASEQDQALRQPCPLLIPHPVQVGVGYRAKELNFWKYIWFKTLGHSEVVYAGREWPLF